MNDEALMMELTDRPLVREQVVAMRERLDLEPDPHQRDFIVHRLWKLLRELRKMDGFSINWAVACSAAFCLAVVLVLIHAERKTATHLRVLHDVLVLERLDDYNFKLSAYDPYLKQWNDFALTACKTFKPTKEIQRGVTLTLLQFENQDEGCVDFRLLSNGYTLLRGQHNEPIITDARPSTGATISGAAAETTSTTSRAGAETTGRPVAEGVKP